MSAQLCPICGAAVRENPRYPKRLCEACAAKAVSADGRLLVFGNVAMSGGFSAGYADSDEPYEGGHVCFVDGRQCWADEARFGGIVIQPGDPRAEMGAKA